MSTNPTPVPEETKPSRGRGRRRKSDGGEDNVKYYRASREDGQTVVKLDNEVPELEALQLALSEQNSIFRVVAVHTHLVRENGVVKVVPKS